MIIRRKGVAANSGSTANVMALVGIRGRLLRTSPLLPSRIHPDACLPIA